MFSSRGRCPGHRGHVAYQLLCCRFACDLYSTTMQAEYQEAQQTCCDYGSTSKMACGYVGEILTGWQFCVTRGPPLARLASPRPACAGVHRARTAAARTGHTYSGVLAGCSPSGAGGAAGPASAGRSSASGSMAGVSEPGPRHGARPAYRPPAAGAHVIAAAHQRIGGVLAEGRGREWRDGGGRGEGGGARAAAFVSGECPAGAQLSAYSRQPGSREQAEYCR